jgi:hypothetical protein
MQISLLPLCNISGQPLLIAKHKYAGLLQRRNRYTSKSHILNCRMPAFGNSLRQPVDVSFMVLTPRGLERRQP